MEPLRVEDPRRIGTYQVLARLGAGGMGQVFLGGSPGGRLVAIKLIHQALSDDPQFRARFRRETALALKVSGAFTAAVVHADPEAPRPWLATVYLPGVSLREAVAAHGPMPPPAVHALGAGLAEALGAIHRAGVVHRDLKPANVLLTPEGPRVIDFGIARAADATAITQTGELIGSPGYMAPEQAADGDTGPSGDVFSMGAVLTYAATGAGPFGDGTDAFYRAVHERPRLDGVPDGRLRQIIAACLHKDPAERPDATLLATWLTAGHGPRPLGTHWLPGPVVATIRNIETQPVPPPLRPGPSRRAVLIGGGAVLSLAGAGTAAALLWPREDPPYLWSRDEEKLAFEGEPVVTAGGLCLIERDAYGVQANAYRLAGVDARTGGRRWRVPVSVVNRSVPLVTAAGYGYTVDRSRGEAATELVALDLTTGRIPWRHAVEVDSATNLVFPAVAAGTVCLWARGSRSGDGERAGAGRSPSPPGAGPRGRAAPGDGEGLYAFDARTGRPRWQYPTESGGGPPAAAGEAFYACVAAELHKVEAATGRRRWTRKVAEFPRSVPVIAGDLVVVTTVGSRQHSFAAFDAASGRLRWRAAAEGVDDEFARTPVVGGGLFLYAGASGRLFAFDAASGRVRWTFDLGRGSELRPEPVPSVHGDTVYVSGGAAQQLYALEAATGRGRWRQPLPGPTTTRPVLSGGLVHAGSHALSSFDARTGRLVRRLSLGQREHASATQVTELTAAGGVLYAVAGGGLWAVPARPPG